MKTKKNFSDLCSEAPARRSFKIIEFLEFEKGALRSTFFAFLAQKSETELDFRNEKFLDESTRWEPVVACKSTYGKII